jgi:hypothetical protein
MIEVRQLRIGNILNYKGELHHVTSLSLDIDDEYQDLIGITPLGKWSGEKQDWNRAFGDDLKPESITSGWLSRLGLNGYISKKIVGAYSITIPVLPAIIETVSIQSPQNIHQLQNLYFALTGEELTIK